MASLTEEHLVDGESFHFRAETIPAEFHDINCFQIYGDDYTAEITLKHCVDHTQGLVFEGLTEYQKERRAKPAIILYSNEIDVEKELLWPAE